MKSNIRLKQLHGNVTARVSATEAERIKAAAAAAGLTVSDWVRRTMLEAMDCPPWARLLLAEFLALRSVLVDLQAAGIQGTKPSTEHLKAVLDVADQRKFAQADGRLLTLKPTAKETK